MFIICITVSNFSKSSSFNLFPATTCSCGVEIPIIPKVESKRMTREELEEIKAVKMKMLSTILDKLAVPPTTSPVQARNFAMASKPVGVRLAWVCNFKHAMHSSPCGCAKPHLGGKWVILGKNSTDEIKDDK